MSAKKTPGKDKPSGRKAEKKEREKSKVKTEPPKNKRTSKKNVIEQTAPEVEKPPRAEPSPENAKITLKAAALAMAFTLIGRNHTDTVREFLDNPLVTLDQNPELLKKLAESWQDSIEHAAFAAAFALSINVCMKGSTLKDLISSEYFRVRSKLYGFGINIARQNNEKAWLAVWSETEKREDIAQGRRELFTSGGNAAWEKLKDSAEVYAEKRFRRMARKLAESHKVADHLKESLKIMAG